MNSQRCTYSFSRERDVFFCRYPLSNPNPRKKLNFDKYSSYPKNFFKIHKSMIFSTFVSTFLEFTEERCVLNEIYIGAKLYKIKFPIDNVSIIFFLGSMVHDIIVILYGYFQIL